MNALTGTGVLMRLALRRDRVLLPVWITAFLMMAVTSAAATKDLFPTVASIVQAASLMNGTPALVAVYGRIFDPTSLGALAMLKAMGSGSVLVAIFSIIVVVRHTRAEEDAGRLELVGSGVVGRWAPLTAALSVAIGADVVLGLVTGIAVALAGLPVAGSLAFGLAWVCVGLVFACVAAVTVQLVASKRAATGLALAVLGLAFLLRAVGDVTGPRWLSWLSPLAWAQQLRPYEGDRWWVAWIALAFAAIVAAVAYLLVARRDHGAGMLPDRLGPAGASRWLRGPFSLAWRLQRGSLIGWTIGFVLYGLLVGSVAGSIGDMVGSAESQEMFRALGGVEGLTDAVFAAMFGLLGVVAAGYGVQAAMRLHAEESDHRADPVLVAGVSRACWVMSHVSVALTGTALLLVGAGLAAGVVHAVRTGDATQVGRVFAGAVVEVPAAWVLTGVAVVLFGAARALAGAGWAVLAVFLLLGDLGPVLKLDQWLMDLSPFTHVPHLPGGTFAAMPMAWLAVSTLLLTGAGLMALRRRDVG
ncbi:ABC transporter permease [Lentzea sp. BCCO 10_0061]|uniref:ABC transporter permease n=1 Tax=Lentzea sokolovensis TaxID=3095429 RepID=A0ABU4UPJ4_9PSEU|nr:ABC transporter permease [Lentzea sp. BCCO 10_0061]MDX8141412.1 ABC transporter permease [Lentzea sp. BCCO 10_0061]